MSTAIDRLPAILSDQAPTSADSEVEHIKFNSNYLRGTIAEGLADPITGAIAAPDTQLLKLHGMYQQDDRDLRLERQDQKLEPLYSFMLRVRLPGGVCTPAQYLTLDHIAQTYANGTLRLTTRQTFQFHGLLKRNIRNTFREMDSVLVDSIAACGDVNRNVTCSPNPQYSALHAEVYGWAKRLSEHLLPRTFAYRELWLGKEKVPDGQPESEPIYGKRYLPRKFKIALAIPPENDVDLFTNDLGFIAVEEAGRLVGFNVAVGGGMGTTHGETATYPRLANVIGFCLPEQCLAVAEAVLTTQRDHGDRTNRKHARLKYTIDTMGLTNFVDAVNARLASPLLDAKPFQFTTTGDRVGWVKGTDGKYSLTLHILSGRIRDTGDSRLLTGLRAVAQIHEGDFRCTPNQNLMIAGISEAKRPVISRLLRDHGIHVEGARTGLRLHALSCVAFPTCGLAMAEAERYLPDFLLKLEAVLDGLALSDVPITLRMTGCPNGCARPFVAEIGLVGKNPGKYNLYLGAAFNGERLSQLVREGIDETQILQILIPLLKSYKEERREGEHFGDFVMRTPGVLQGR